MAFAALEPADGIRRTGGNLTSLRRALDSIYLGCGYLAAASMAMILIVTLAQIVTRYLGLNVRGLTDFAGYFMAASAFLAFPMALNRGAHVRIEMFLSIQGRFRRLGELTAIGVSTVIAAWFAFYSCKMVYVSWKFGDLSTGLDATPLWIPQTSMAIGAVVFAVAILDQFLQLLLTGAHSVHQSSGIE